MEQKQIDDLKTIEVEYKKLLAEKEGARLDAIEKEKLEKIKKDILDGLQKPVEKKIVFSPIPEKVEDNTEYKSFHDFLKMMITGELRQKTAMSTTNAQGGYVIPKDYSSIIVNSLNNVAKAPAKCTNVRVNTGTTYFPAYLTDMTVAWSTEATDKTTTKPTFTQKTMSLRYLYALITMTNELFEDNDVDLSNQLLTLVGENFGLELEQEILEGTTFTGVDSGANDQPLTSVITYADLVSAINNSSVLERYKMNAEWWLTRGSLSLIMNLVDQNGRPIWNLGSPSEGGVPSSILGRPYNLSDQIADTLSTAGSTSIYYGDMKTVYLGSKNGDQIDVLETNVGVVSSSTSVSENCLTENKHMFRYEMRKGIMVAVPTAWVKITNITG